ncbi:hypothetical protein ACFPRL_16245 [Pseudoclavibacter helvolus]
MTPLASTSPRNPSREAGTRSSSRSVESSVCHVSETGSVTEALPRPSVLHETASLRTGVSSWLRTRSMVNAPAVWHWCASHCDLPGEISTTSVDKQAGACA